jgi:hypothetical protein
MESTEPPRVRPARRDIGPRRRRRVAALALAVIATAAFVLTSSSPGSAQAAFVNASVRTDPPLPQPGQDVSVSVRVTGCPPGDTDVQILLAADAPGGVDGALMADAPARTSLLWRTKARIELTDAVQGWYGVRIQCGSYRPPQTAMANTAFAVGADPVATMSLSARSVNQGGSVTLSGDGCPGPSVDYEIAPRATVGEVFIATASIPTQADGTWSGQVPVPTQLDPGPVLVRARCVEVNQLGLTVYVSYGTPLDLRIEPAS